jgi:hypothetical protein
MGAITIMEEDGFLDESPLQSSVSFVRLTSPQFDEFTKQLATDEPAALAWLASFPLTSIGEDWLLVDNAVRALLPDGSSIARTLFVDDEGLLRAATRLCLVPAASTPLLATQLGAIAPSAVLAHMANALAADAGRAARQHELADDVSYDSEYELAVTLLGKLATCYFLAQQNQQLVIRIEG